MSVPWKYRIRVFFHCLFRLHRMTTFTRPETGVVFGCGCDNCQFVYTVNGCIPEADLK